MQTGVTGASKEIFVVDFDRTGVTGANKEIFVVDFDTLFTIGSEIFIFRVLPLWQGHRIDAQCTHDYKIDSPSTEEVPHQETPIVQPLLRRGFWLHCQRVQNLINCFQNGVT